MPEEKYEDREAALAAALDWTAKMPLDRELREISFGRFAAAGEGWYWRLGFVIEAGNTIRRTQQPMSARFDRIIRAWAEATEQYLAVDKENQDERA